jgi:hypothetical protein
MFAYQGTNGKGPLSGAEGFTDTRTRAQIIRRDVGWGTPKKRLREAHAERRTDVGVVFAEKERYELAHLVTERQVAR